MRSFLPVIFTAIMSTATMAETSCFTIYDLGKYSYKMNTCSPEGQLLTIQEYFLSTHSLSSETFFNELGIKDKIINYSTEGDFRIKNIQYTPSTYIETTYVQNSLDTIEWQIEFTTETKTKIREWEYQKGELKWIDTYSQIKNHQITKRVFPLIGHSYHLSYKPKSRYHDEIASFNVFNYKQEMIGSYRYHFDGNIENILRQQYSGSELEEKLSQYHNNQRLPVAIIDSGFDIRHPQLTAFFHRASDGLISAFSFYDRDHYDRNINEKLIIGSLKPTPISHGTHVASIAINGKAQSSILAFAGDVSKPEYLNLISMKLKKENIRAANLSWGFKELGSPFTPPPSSYHALQSLIENNKQTLFYVAAGNNGWDLEGDLKDYPASYEYNNLFVVGALNTDNYKWNKPEELVPAKFSSGLGSNTGHVSVDIFAPGKNVNGAKLGGGMIRKSGTSMASPYALNATISVMTALPHFSATQIKELMMKTAGFPPQDLPCVSKGFIHPPRALAVANYLKNNPMLTIEQAIIQGQFSSQYLYPYEVTKAKQELRKVWLRIDRSLGLIK